MSEEWKQIEAVLDEKVRPSLRAHGGELEIDHLEDGVLYIKLLGQCAGCPSADLTNETLIEHELTAALPELVQKYPYDPAKAKELLAQAGYPNGFDMTISVPSNYQPHMDTAEVVAEQLRAVGVNVTIQPMEWGVWHEQVYKGRDFQATLVGLDASAMTARALLERFTSDNAKNFVNYNNPDYDALFTQAINASDDAQQAEVYKQMETMLSDTAANLYIQDLADLVAMRQNLAGLEFYPIYVLDLSTVHFVK